LKKKIFKVLLSFCGFQLFHPLLCFFEKNGLQHDDSEEQNGERTKYQSFCQS
jgi:hypothetical protein